MSVIGVHGVFNYRGAPGPSAIALSSEWTRCVQRGFASASAEVTIDVAYYAHLLHREISMGSNDVEQMDPDVQGDVVRWADLIAPPGVEVIQGELLRPVRSAIERVATRYRLEGQALRRFVTLFFPEVHTYFTDPARRTAVRDRVVDAVRATGEPRVVVAHSLGSVVAYEALWRLPETPIDLLVTLGSPLGLPGVVFDRLDPAPTNQKGRRPPSVRRWLNIADPGDVVAIPRPLSDKFRGIDGTFEPSIDWLGIHGVCQYLSHSTTAAALAPYLPFSGQP